MRLLLDLGNTRLKWALADAHGALSPMQALVHQAGAACWHPLLKDLAHVKLTHIALSSVAGARTQALRAALQAGFPEIAILEARSLSRCAGVLNGYTKPATLGVDRFMALLGAPNPDQTTRVIAMLGTALTIDILLPDGVHLGGLIAPGPSLMQASLHHGTANLPLVSGRSQCIGQNTADAIFSGCQRACGALINAVMQDHPGASLVLSGGAAADIQAQLTYPARLMPSLVLLGLQRYALEFEQME